MHWQEYLLIALAVYLLLEGVLLFLSPRRSKRLLQRIERMPEAGLRLCGAALMAAGAALLFALR